MDSKVKKFLRFKWKGKLYEWQVLPFGLKCSPRILTNMVKPIVTFLRGRGISLTAFMDDFTNQAGCRCKAIFQIHVIALVFMCCGWSVNWTKTILEPTQSPIHLGFLWDTVGRTIALPEDKTTRVESWAKKLLANKKTTQEDLECFVGTLVSTTPAVWKAPLHYRALQITLLVSLRKFGRDKRRSVFFSHGSLRDLDWWASGGLRANNVSPWRMPSPTLHIWSDASTYAGGAVSDSGSHFQRSWSEEESRKHINWLELRAARYALLELASPGDVVQLHLDNMTAIAFIRKLGGTRSRLLCKESLLLWRQAIRRNITILPPQWISTEENTEADFLSRHKLLRWDFKLAPSEFRRICRRLQVRPTLDAFASRGSHQIPRYMTWEEDHRAVAINALDYYWDPVTWLFPPVPLLPLVLERVQEQQIEAILICPGWKGAMWWPQLVELRTETAPVRLPAAADCLKLPKGSTEELPRLDPLYAFLIRGKTV